MDKENPWGKDRTGKDVDLHLYRSMIRSLMYLTASRPDIMFAGNSQNNIDDKGYWDSGCSRHMTGNISYLSDYKLYDGGYVSFGQGGCKITGKGTIKTGLWYPKDSPFDLVAYSDSDYGGATQDRKSTTGGCQFLGRRLILWQCKKQIIIAISATEAEYVAATSGCGQVLHHFIRDCFEKKLISVDHIHTDDNVADLLTKPFDAGRLQPAFCDNHNMVAILEKYEHNVDFHQIVDFVEASHIRIETTDEGTKIPATVDGKPITISKLSIRRNLKLKDEAGISSLPDAKLFENLTLMGYNISPNQKFSFQKGRTVPLFESMLVSMGEGSGTLTEPQHTPSPEAQQSPPTATSLQSLPPVTTESFPTVIPTETPHPGNILGELGLLSPQLFLLLQISPHLLLGMTVKTKMASKFAAQDLEIASLKARIKLLEDKDGGDDEPSREDATIKGEFGDRGGSSCREEY
nr:hypothetical protein [Tanacetum cinerariifolium]